MPQFTVYAKEGCGYCVRAVDLLNQTGSTFEYLSVTENPDLKNEILRRNPDATTLPQIFEGETLIGGYDQLAAYFKAKGN